jgi:very-short-patch-repair endonuclease
MTRVGPFDDDSQREKGPRGRVALDPVISELGARQHGRVARWQLLDFGIGPGAIDHRVRTKRLHVVLPGVYAVGHRSAGRKGAWMSAVLYAGPNALLSHLDAGALWGICTDSSARTHVTTTDRGRKPRPGVAVHRVRELALQERTERDGIPVTSLARTLLDLARMLDARRLERAIEEAERLGLFNLPDVDAVLARGNGRRGATQLRLELAKRRLPEAFTRADGERLLRELCRDAGLPQPAMNLWVEGYEVDALFEDARLIVEVDSFEYHGSRAAFERDRKRDAALHAAGYRVMRITYDRLENEPAAVAAELRTLLGEFSHRPGMRA